LVRPTHDEIAGSIPAAIVDALTLSGSGTVSRGSANALSAIVPAASFAPRK